MRENLGVLSQFCHVIQLPPSLIPYSSFSIVSFQLPLLLLLSSHERLHQTHRLTNIAILLTLWALLSNSRCGTFDCSLYHPAGCLLSRVANISSNAEPGFPFGLEDVTSKFYSSLGFCTRLLPYCGQFDAFFRCSILGEFYG